MACHTSTICDIGEWHTMNIDLLSPRVHTASTPYMFVHVCVHVCVVMLCVYIGK